MGDSGEPLGSRVVRLHELAAGVAVDVSRDLAGSAAVELLAELNAAASQLELARIKLIERVDRSGAFGEDGSRSTVAFLRRAANETRDWASQRVQLARVLANRMPFTLKAWEAGQLGMAQARIIASAIEHLNDDVAADIEHTLAEAAPYITTQDLANLAELVRQQNAPDEAARKHRSEHEKQSLTFVKTLHGSWDLKGRFDAESGAVIHQVLDAFTARAGKTRGPDGQLVDPPPASWRRAQALVDICRLAAGHHEQCDPTVGFARPTIVATIAVEQLQKLAHGVGDIEGGDVLTAAVLRRWACDADLIPKVLGSDGETLDFGRRTRLISPGLRRYLISRDGGCLYPNCDAPPERCQVHHSPHWADGGETKPEHLSLQCIGHHHLVHEEGWILVGNPEIAGDLRYQPPDANAPPVRAERKTVHAVKRRLRDLRNSQSVGQPPAETT